MVASWVDQPMDEMLASMAFTADQQKKLCVNYSQHGNFARACIEVGVNRATAKLKIKEDPVFAANFEMAKDLFVAKLEDEALHRIFVGEKHDIIHRGEVVGTKTVKSDTLLRDFLKANNPEKYGDKVSLEAASGGVLVIGAPQQSQAAWLEQNRTKKLPAGDE